MCCLGFGVYKKEVEKLSIDRKKRDIKNKDKEDGGTAEIKSSGRANVENKDKDNIEKDARPGIKAKNLRAKDLEAEKAGRADLKNRDKKQGVRQDIIAEDPAVENQRAAKEQILAKQLAIIFSIFFV